MNLVLGGGLAGLSTAYHLGHENCLILEKQGAAGGHIRSERRDNCSWDIGPHVSFTKHGYVKRLFAESVQGASNDLEVTTANYFHGHWLDHPAQCNLYQVPEPQRTRCVESFLSRPASLPAPRNYGEWLATTFGDAFAKWFPGAYARKYWTVEASDLSLDWIGQRVYSPRPEELVAGSRGPLPYQTHYITQARYPREGGFQSFARVLLKQANVRLGAAVERIDLSQKRVWTAAGEAFDYERLINTLPLPVFVSRCNGVPPDILDAARALLCSQLLLVNVHAPRTTFRKGHWFYVYDEDKLSTRFHLVERLSNWNAPPDQTGAQVEVYFSRRRPLTESPGTIAARVVTELAEMGVIEDTDSASARTRWVPWANIVFDTHYSSALEVIYRWLEDYGLERAAGDLWPTTDWARVPSSPPGGSLLLAGRFGQWKYYWTDDCVLRGAWIAGKLCAS